MSNQRPRSILVTATLLTAFVTAGVPALHAQAVSIASVTGRVIDEQGAVVAGAQIRMSGVETGATYTVATNGDGIYTIPSLPIGAYTLQAAPPGSKPICRRACSCG
jgi:hypothetical protein